MKKIDILKVSVVALLLLCVYRQPISLAAEVKSAKSGYGIQIDIPVKLEKAKVVFNMDHLAFSGDVPVGIKYMHLLAKRMKERAPRAKSSVSFTAKRRI